MKTMYKGNICNCTTLLFKKVGCVICGKSCDDVHHIKEQARANKDGFIGHINANHKYNLIPLCKEHHKMVHDGTINVNGFVATSKGLELHYTMVEKN